MPLVCLGLSHRTAPVEARERHAFPASRMAEALIALRDYEMVREAVMLATCGRIEIYAELEDYEQGVDSARSKTRTSRRRRPARSARHCTPSFAKRWAPASRRVRRRGSVRTH